MASWPLLRWIQNMDYLELSLFWVAWLAFFLGTGFAAHYIYGRKSMGHYWNSLYGALGAYLGVCVHDLWFQTFSAYEPALSVFLIAGGMLGALQTATVISSW
ncbi:MAG TPA: hypothetical protein VMI72_03370 [Roseiarcus sp.]|nr:hypothetical protein [Roseiarcus sp.]